MEALDPATFESLHRELLANRRIEVRIPVALEWDQNGLILRAYGVTLDVSPEGCLITVMQRFRPGQRLKLVNLNNGHSSGCTLIWISSAYGWELGLQLESPRSDFWEADS